MTGNNTNAGSRPFRFNRRCRRIISAQTTHRFAAGARREYSLTSAEQIVNLSDGDLIRISHVLDIDPSQIREDGPWSPLIRVELAAYIAGRLGFQAQRPANTLQWLSMRALTHLQPCPATRRGADHPPPAPTGRFRGPGGITEQFRQSSEMIASVGTSFADVADVYRRLQTQLEHTGYTIGVDEGRSDEEVQWSDNQPENRLVSLGQELENMDDKECRAAAYLLNNIVERTKGSSISNITTDRDLLNSMLLVRFTIAISESDLQGSGAEINTIETQSGITRIMKAIERVDANAETLLADMCQALDYYNRKFGAPAEIEDTVHKAITYHEAKRYDKRKTAQDMVDQKALDGTRKLGRRRIRVNKRKQK